MSPKVSAPVVISPRTFAVSRIVTARIENGTFTPRPEFYEEVDFDNFDERDPYGNIVIRLTRAGRQFAVATVLHSRQKIVDNRDGTFTMTVPQKAKHLAVQWILAQRGEAVPVAPAELVDDVIAAGRKITKAALAQKETNKQVEVQE